MDQVKFVEDSLYGLLRQTISLQIFWRLSSTNLLGPFFNTLTHLLYFKSLGATDCFIPLENI